MPPGVLRLLLQGESFAAILAHTRTHAHRHTHTPNTPAFKGSSCSKRIHSQLPTFPNFPTDHYLITLHPSTGVNIGSLFIHHCIIVCYLALLLGCHCYCYCHPACASACSSFPSRQTHQFNSFNQSITQSLNHSPNQSIPSINSRDVIVETTHFKLRATPPASRPQVSTLPT